MAIAVFNNPPGLSVALPANVTQKVLGIQLNTGNNISPYWTIFGKVVIANPNASPVNVVAELVPVPAHPGTPAVLDTSSATIPANGTESISLEGVLPPAPAGVSPATCVEITCHALPLSADAEFPRLIAISVDPAVVAPC
jgi:hypothetical protein